MHHSLKDFGLIPHETKENHIGSTHTNLTIWAVGKKQGSYRYMALCDCSCGTSPYLTRLDKVLAGLTQSCGCFHAAVITKHGKWNHPLYPLWRGIVQRCTEPNNRSYPRYGGRGIKVCERWLNPDNFISDMGPTYKKGLQIERVDNDRDYSPENCRWATQTEQQRNKRSNIRITLDGKTKVLSEWCKDFGVRYQLAWERIKLQGWHPHKALSTPARKIINPKR